MKKKIQLLIIVCMSSILYSCKIQSYTFAQIFEATAQNNNSSIVREDNGLLYSDNNCEIFYSFWAEGGDASFIIYNKTDQMIYIDLTKSFFVRNGVANDYYKERIWGISESNTSSSTIRNENTTIAYNTTNNYSSRGNVSSYASASAYKNSAYAHGYSNMNYNARSEQETRGYIYSQSIENTYSTSKNSSIEIKEKPIIAIPPKSSKIIAEYSINKKIILDCSLTRYPKDSASIEFDYSNTPLTFENYITYRIGNDEHENVIENKFYISKITNFAMPALQTFVKRPQPCKNITTAVTEHYYKEKYATEVYDKVLKIDTHNCFYIIYEVESQHKIYQKEKINYFYNRSYDGYTKYAPSSAVYSPYDPNKE